MNAAPGLVWLNRQRTVPPDQLQLSSAAHFVQRAWPRVVAEEGKGSVLAALPEIIFVVVSDARIAAIHGEFMGDPSATDVITFHHGEVALSAETARREAAARGIPLPQEIARYAVHGLLHLAGWDDRDRASASEMRRTQEKILRSVFRGVC